MTASASERPRKGKYTVELLSPQWCDHVVRACAAAPAELIDVVVEVQITGAARGRGRVAVVVDGGRLTECVAERRADADINLKTTWDDLCAMIRGELDPNVAFMKGDLKTEGPTGPLLALLSAWQRPAVQAARVELADLTDGLD